MKNDKYDKALYRISSIQHRLYEGETLNKNELAHEFNVSAKTIQRDINERLSSVPIEQLKGIGFKLKKEFIDKKKAILFYEQINAMQQHNVTQLNILRAKDAIESAAAILISVGAGMGVDSGLPDFRGDEGFWKAYPPMKELGLNFADMANPKWFTQKSNLAWGFYGHRLNLYRNTEPHEGFAILKQLVSYKNNNYFIFTSNVDGQFQKAGFDENKIYECHGSIHHNQCLENCNEEVWRNIGEEFSIDAESFTVDTKDIPKCIHCGGIARPNILMFGDYGFNTKRHNMQNTRFHQWLQKNLINKTNIVIIEVGAGEHIPTVRRLSEEIATQYGAALIRINPRDFDVIEGQISIALNGLEALQKIYND